MLVGGVVLFNPNISRLDENLTRLINHVDKVILFDNTEGAGNSLKNRFMNVNKIIYMGEEKNKGVAYALNRIMEQAEKMDADWVLTLDQDSIIPDNMLEEYGKYISQGNVALICPQIIDKRRKYMKVKNEPVMETVDFCMTSGSYVSVKIWKELNGFDEWLFIDLVDNDFCKRVRLSGYEIVRVNTVILDHELGQIEPRSRILGKFFIALGEKLHSENISKLSFKRKVSPMRIYYENRNVLYLNKKFCQYGGIGYDNHHCKTYIGFFIVFSVYSWMVSDKKRMVYKAIRQGLEDGRKAKPAEWTKKSGGYLKSYGREKC